MGRAIEFPPAGYLTYINIERHPPIITENDSYRLTCDQAFFVCFLVFLLVCLFFAQKSARTAN